MCGTRINLLHIEEAMVQWLNEPGGEEYESREVLLHCRVDSVELVCSDLEILFKLRRG